MADNEDPRIAVIKERLQAIWPEHLSSDEVLAAGIEWAELISIAAVDAMNDWAGETTPPDLNVVGREAEEFIPEGSPIEVNPETGKVRVVRDYTPHFTGKFDLPDYEAFYLTITSAAGIDEGISVEHAADIIVESHIKGES
jgi:hypothetical protein